MSRIYDTLKTRFKKMGVLLLVCLCGMSALQKADAAPPTNGVLVPLKWKHSVSPDVESYSVDYGTDTNWLTNALIVGYVTNATVIVPDGERYYFGVCAVNSNSVYSKRSNLVKDPPDVIHSASLEFVNGPVTSVLLYRITNSPPTNQSFKVTTTEEKSYAP